MSGCGVTFKYRRLDGLTRSPEILMELPYSKCRNPTSASMKLLYHPVQSPPHPCKYNSPLPHVQLQKRNIVRHKWYSKIPRGQLSPFCLCKPKANLPRNLKPKLSVSLESTISSTLPYSLFGAILYVELQSMAPKQSPYQYH